MGKVVNRKTLILIIIWFILLTLLFLSVKFSNKKIKKTFSTIEVGDETFPKNPVLNAPVPYLDILEQINLDEHIRITEIRHSIYPGRALVLTDENNIFVSWLPESELVYYKGISAKSLGDVMDWWSFEDIDKDNHKELVAQFGIAGSAGVHPFYLYTYKNGEFTLLFKLVEAKSKAEIIDLDNDGTKEIIYKYALSGSGNRERETLRWKDIWRIENGKPVKVSNQFPNEYKELIPIYDEILTSMYNAELSFRDYEVYLCLKEKAELNINGQFADAESCRKIYNNKYK